MGKVKLFNPNNLDDEERKIAFQGLREVHSIGGSRAPGIMGVGWNSPLSTYCSMKGLTKPPSGDGIWMGREMEPWVRKHAAEKLIEFGFFKDVKIRAHQSFYRSDKPEQEFMIGQVDGTITTKELGRGGVEVKLKGTFDAPRWKNGATPEDVLLQVAHYMEIFDLEYFVIVFFISWEMNFRLVYRESMAAKVKAEKIQAEKRMITDKEISDLIRAETEFRDKYLIPGEMPDPTGSDADLEVIKQVFGVTVIKDPIALDDIVEIVKCYKQAGKMIKAAEDQRAEWKNKIILELGGHATGTIAGKPAVTLRTIIANRVNNDRLKEDGLYEHYLDESPYQRLDVYERYLR